MSLSYLSLLIGSVFVLLLNLNSLQLGIFCATAIKRRHIYHFIDIFNHTSFKKACSVNHPLYNLLPRVKESSLRLRNTSILVPRINTEQFKAPLILTGCVMWVILVLQRTSLLLLLVAPQEF